MLQEIVEAIEEIERLADSLPSGIDYEADPLDTSPENLEAHIGGLIWQTCQRLKRDLTGLIK